MVPATRPARLGRQPRERQRQGPAPRHHVGDRGSPPATAGRPPPPPAPSSAARRRPPAGRPGRCRRPPPPGGGCPPPRRPGPGPARGVAGLHDVPGAGVVDRPADPGHDHVEAAGAEPQGDRGGVQHPVADLDRPGEPVVADRRDLAVLARGRPAARSRPGGGRRWPVTRPLRMRTTAAQLPRSVRRPQDVGADGVAGLDVGDRSTSTSGPASWNRASSWAQAVGQAPATRAMAQLCSLTT